MPVTERAKLLRSPCGVRPCGVRPCGVNKKEVEQMEIKDIFSEDVDNWKTVIFLYTAALKEVNTKLEILNDEFQHVHQYNPIEYFKSRIKTPESIVKK